jgi:hypothetical protein
MNTDAVHARGCSQLLDRPSQMLTGYRYCPECQRMIREEDW